MALHDAPGKNRSWYTGHYAGGAAPRSHPSMYKNGRYNDQVWQQYNVPKPAIAMNKGKHGLDEEPSSRPARKTKTPRARIGDDAATNANPTLIEEIKNKHLPQIQKLLTELRHCRDDAKTNKNKTLKNTHWYRHNDEVIRMLGDDLDNLAFAQIHTVNNSGVGLGSAPLSTAGVVYLTPEEYKEFAKNPSNLRKPIVIPCELPQKEEVIYDRFIKKLRFLFAGGDISIQDYSLHKDANSYKSWKTNTVLDRLEQDRPSTLNNVKKYMPLNLLDIEYLKLIPDTGVLLDPRYDLLSVCDKRDEVEKRRQKVEAENKGKTATEKAPVPTLTPGKKHEIVGRSCDISACQGFTIFAQRGCYSGPHSDYLNGTWVQCLTGLKLWIVFPPTQDETANAKALQDYEEQGDRWVPEVGRGQIIVLRPGDLLLMPPGSIVPHAPLTVEDCLMVGGMYWDNLTITQTVRNLTWILEHPMVTNEGNIVQYRDILRHLHDFVKEFPEEFANGGDEVEFLEKFGKEIRKTRDALRPYLIKHDLPLGEESEEEEEESEDESEDDDAMETDQAEEDGDDDDDDDDDDDMDVDKNYRG